MYKIYPFIILTSLCLSIGGGTFLVLIDKSMKNSYPEHIRSK